MRISNYTQTEIHTDLLKKKDTGAAIFSLLCIGSCLRKIKCGKKQVDAFLEMSLAKSPPTKDSFPSKALQGLSQLRLSPFLFLCVFVVVLLSFLVVLQLKQIETD